jgi:hypothetical protein
MDKFKTRDQIGAEMQELFGDDYNLATKFNEELQLNQLIFQQKMAQGMEIEEALEGLEFKYLDPQSTKEAILEMFKHVYETNYKTMEKSLKIYRQNQQGEEQ